MNGIAQQGTRLAQMFAAKHDQENERYYDLGIVLISVTLMS